MFKFIYATIHVVDGATSYEGRVEGVITTFGEQFVMIDHVTGYESCQCCVQTARNSNKS